MIEIGIVIAAYNSEETIERAVRSVLNQTNPLWKLMIVDDGSTDATLEIAKKYAEGDSRISYIHQDNAGTSKARAAGYEAIQSDWLAFLDADDELELDYVESMSSLIDDNPGYVFYACNLLFRFAKRESIEWEHQKPTRISLARWGESPDIALNGAVIQRSYYESVGGFGEYSSYVEDFYLLVRLLLVGDALVNPKILYIYYLQVKGQKSSRKMKVWKSCILALNYIKETVDLSPEQEKVLEERIQLYKRLRRLIVLISLRNAWHNDAKPVVKGALTRVGLLK